MTQGSLVSRLISFAVVVLVARSGQRGLAQVNRILRRRGLLGSRGRIRRGRRLAGRLGACKGTDGADHDYLHLIRLFGRPGSGFKKKSREKRDLACGLNQANRQEYRHGVPALRPLVRLGK